MPKLGIRFKQIYDLAFSTLNAGQIVEQFGQLKVFICVHLLIKIKLFYSSYIIVRKITTFSSEDQNKNGP